MTVEVVLGLGSNLGDRVENLLEACVQLQRRSAVLLQQFSAVVESSPLLLPEDHPEADTCDRNQGAFANQIVIGQTTLAPVDLLAAIKSIEKDLGRAKAMRWGPRLIDIDILAYGDESVLAPGLSVPHTDVSERDFVLGPWAELQPARVLPGLELTLDELRRALLQRRQSEEGADWEGACLRELEGGSSFERSWQQRCGVAGEAG